MIKVTYKNGKDLGFENWRLSININVDEIEVVLENFGYGFYSGEQYDKIFKKNEDLYISYITKDKDKITDSLRDKLVDKFEKLINKKIKANDDKIRQYMLYKKQYQSYLKSDLFKQKLRDDKIDKILGI